jgi:hypothetical protein
VSPAEGVCSGGGLRDDGPWWGWYFVLLLLFFFSVSFFYLFRTAQGFFPSVGSMVLAASRGIFMVALFFLFLTAKGFLWWHRDFLAGIRSCFLMFLFSFIFFPFLFILLFFYVRQSSKIIHGNRHVGLFIEEMEEPLFSAKSR